MNEVIGGRAPGWLRIVALVAVLWNLIGVYFYLVHVGAAPGPEVSEAEAEISRSMPSWATACFAVGVFGGTLGALGLLMLKAWSRSMLLLSFLALLGSEGWILFLSGAPQRLGPSAYGLPITIVVIALLLLWLANSGTSKGWLS
jgi:hypothetical protein